MKATFKEKEFRKDEILIYLDGSVIATVNKNNFSTDLQCAEIVDLICNSLNNNNKK
jgi:hypothetical protein